MPPELAAAVQDYASQSSVNATLFNQDAHEILLEMEQTLAKCLRQLTVPSSSDFGGYTVTSCDLFCTRSGYLGRAGEGTAESGLHLVLSEKFPAVAMVRKKKRVVDEWYEYVDGAYILGLDWKSYRTFGGCPN